MRVAARRQTAANYFLKCWAYTAKIKFLQQLLHQRPVTNVFLQQFLADGIFQAGNFVFRFVAELLEENFTPKRIAVRVQAARFDADDHVAALDGFLAVEHPGFFHHADDRAAHVVFARLVKARHLRRLAADEAQLFSAHARAKPLIMSVNTCGSSLPVPR